MTLRTRILLVLVSAAGVVATAIAVLVPPESARTLIAITSILLVLVALELSTQVVQPVHRLRRQLRRAAHEESRVRLEVRGNDEFAQLAEAFNALLRDLDATHEALREQSARLAEAFKEVENLDSMKDNFLALISHEVRTPLTSILGATSFLRESLSGHPDIEAELEFMEIVEESVHRLTSFMDDALLIARLQAGAGRAEFDEFSWRELLLGEIEHVERSFEDRGIRFESRLDDDLDLVVAGDWTLLQIALRKVVDNAFRHNTDGGFVRLERVEEFREIGNAPLDDTLIAAGTPEPREDLEWIALRLFNSGNVVPEDRMDSLFRHFELGHEIQHHSHGSGLSLPIARDIFQYHGGDLLAARVEGEGMAFYMVLPGRTADRRRDTGEIDLSGVDDVVAAARRQSIDEGVSLVQL